MIIYTLLEIKNHPLDYFPSALASSSSTMTAELYCPANTPVTFFLLNIFKMTGTFDKDRF